MQSAKRNMMQVLLLIMFQYDWFPKAPAQYGVSLEKRRRPARRRVQQDSQYVR